MVTHTPPVLLPPESDRSSRSHPFPASASAKGITHETLPAKSCATKPLVSLDSSGQQGTRAPVGSPRAKGRLPFEIPVRIICLLFTLKTAQKILQNAASFTRHFDSNLRTKSMPERHAFGVLKALYFNAFRAQIERRRVTGHPHREKRFNLSPRHQIRKNHPLGTILADHAVRLFMRSYCCYLRVLHRIPHRNGCHTH